MNTFKKEKQTIKKLEEERAKLVKPLNDEISLLLNKIKTECVHPPKLIYEVPYKPHGSCDWDGEASDPPYRVCRVCGVREEGWGCGYKILATKSDVAEITDAEAMKIQRGYLELCD